MEGFIYVLVMSHDIVTKLIDIEYKESGVKGEHYIKNLNNFAKVNLLSRVLLNYKIVSKSIVHTPPSPYTSRVQ